MKVHLCHVTIGSQGNNCYHCEHFNKTIRAAFKSVALRHIYIWKSFGKNALDSHYSCNCHDHLGWCNTYKKLICLMTPKVVKARSVMVTIEVILSSFSLLWITILEFTNLGNMTRRIKSVRQCHPEKQGKYSSRTSDRGKGGDLCYESCPLCIGKRGEWGSW